MLVYLLISSPSNGQRYNPGGSRLSMENLLGEKHYDQWGHHNAEFDHRAFAGDEDDEFHDISEGDASDRLMLVNTFADVLMKIFPYLLASLSIDAYCMIQTIITAIQSAAACNAVINYMLI